MVTALVAALAVSCVGLVGGPPVTMWIAPPIYAISFACCVRMMDHLGGGSTKFSLLGWLHD